MNDTNEKFEPKSLMNNNIPKFLICTNPMYSEENLFILRTSRPCMLMRVKDHPDGSFELTIERIYSEDQGRAEMILKRAHEWYLAYKIKKKNKSI